MSAEKATTSEQTAIGLAHSKLILVGDHAVVHGQPAIAIPLPLVGVESVVEHVPGETKLDCELYHGPLASAPDSLVGIKMCVEAALKKIGLMNSDLRIRITSSIPTGKGLGSSASVAISVTRSLFAYAGKPYTDEDLLELANISETYAHGSPSGIDTLTISSGMPVWYEKGKPFYFVQPKADFHFVVADSGRTSDTKSAVESVAELLKSAPKKIQASLDRLGEITHQASRALERAGKHILGKTLNEAQKELEALGVSDAGLNRLIYIARQEGALGAKLTGSGNGGCILALAKNEAHSLYLTEKLKSLGAHAVWPFVLRKQE